MFNCVYNIKSPSKCFNIISKATHPKGFTQTVFQVLSLSTRYKEVLTITTTNIPKKPVCVLPTYKETHLLDTAFYPNT